MRPKNMEKVAAMSNGWRSTKARDVIGSDDDDKEHMFRGQSLRDIQAATRGRPASANIQAIGFQGICYVVGDKSHEKRSEARRLGLLADVQAGMRAHRSSERVQMAGFLAVVKLMRDYEGALEVRRLKWLENVQAAMRTCADSIDMQETDVRAVAGYACLTAEHGADAARSGVLVD
jgi:hypothetical protein